jgi:hypothetical protein
MTPDTPGTVLLVQGGLWEPVDAERFWRRPGIVAGLRERGLRVLAPDRAVRATSWRAEADHLAGCWRVGYCGG